MADTQFHGLGTENAPADWTIPGSLDLVVKAARAVYDGSSASSDFKPCLEVLSDSGNVVGKYVGSTVTAGDQADVSFGPFLEEAVSAAPPPSSTVVEWESLEGDSTSGLASGSSYTFNTTAQVYGSTLLDLTDTGNPAVLADGWYRFEFGFDCDDPNDDTRPLMVYVEANTQFDNISGPIAFNYVGTFVSLGSIHLSNPAWQHFTSWMPLKATYGYTFTLHNYGANPIDASLDYVNVGYIDAPLPT